MNSFHIKLNIQRVNGKFLLLKYKMKQIPDTNLADIKSDTSDTYGDKYM